MATRFATLLALAAIPLAAQSGADKPFPAHKVIGNVYYVGTADLASFLITTPQGHILINSDFEHTVPLIRASVEKLGFRFADIKIVLGSHAHDDHMEGDALVKELTGARVMAMEQDVPALRQIRPGGKPHPIDRILHDGDHVDLGGADLTAHLTAGHTKGCTTWSMKAAEAGKSYDVVIVCSVGWNPGYVLWNNKDYPQIADDYVHSFATLRKLPCDVFLGAHGVFYHLDEKYAKLAKGGPNPFIDHAGYLAYIDQKERDFTREYDRQKKAAAEVQPTRPPIVGIAHFALKTSDLAAARSFYGHDLGFAELFSIDKPTGGVLLALFKVNDHQYIEVRPEPSTPAQGQFSHLAFETTDARRLRDYLAAKGVAVPASLEPLQDGNLGFKVKDPEGHEIEFQQLMPGSMHSKRFGEALPDSRISARIIHGGVVIHDRAAADRFYRDILGFEETWHGGMTDTRVDWVDMRVPDGDDWLEYMLNVQNPSPRTLGVMYHFGLGVDSVEKADQRLLDRGFTPGEKPKIGRDGKWQLNLYDKDLTRVELMEFKPVQPPCCSPMKSR